MALAFNVSNLGPLSQVGFDFKDLGNVVYFAYKHSGWFNSTDRALSLEQTLASSGASLAAVSTFDREKYEASRKQHGSTWGVARNLSNAVCRIRLPKASTATEGYPGLVSFRALITGLLCFVDKEQIPSIIKHVPISRIFHFEQEGVEFAIEGPYLAALIRYVQSVATEEGADDYQNRILSDIDVQIQRVTFAALSELQNSKHTEIGQIIGLLDWLLTPPSQAKRFIYRTRSLRVWCLAMALSEVGFDLEADHTPITTDFSEASSSIRNESYTAKERVVLVLAPGWETDHGGNLWNQKHSILDTIKRPPRAIPVRAFPAIAYTDIAPYHPQCVSAGTLETAFIGTYIFVRHKLSCDEKISLAARLQTPFKIDQRKYATLLNSTAESEDSDLNSLLSRILLTQGSQLRGVGGDGFLESLVKPLACGYLSKIKKEEDLQLMSSCIRWAFILATISVFICDPDGVIDDSGLDMHFIYTKPIFMGIGVRTSSLRICFIATLHFLDYIRRGQSSQRYRREIWSLPDDSLSEPRGSTISWSALVMKVILNIDKHDLKPEPSGTDATYWGAQNCGLVLQSDFILNPSAKPSAAYVFHATRGHLLDMPTEKGRIVEGQTSTPILRYHDYTPLSDREGIEKILLADPPKYINTLRIDLEPCWESDENKSRFVLRAGGIPKLQLRMSSLYHSAHVSTTTDLITRVQCSGESSLCPGPESILELMLHHPQQNTWALLPLQSMIEKSQTGLPDYEYTSPTNSQDAGNWIAKTHDSDVFVMLALNCKYKGYRDGRHKIITNCLGAGLMKAMRIDRRSTMIILSNEKHSRLLECPASNYSRREDLLRTAAYLIWNNLEPLHVQGPYRIFLVEQVVRLIWQPIGDSTIPSWANAIVRRLVYYKELKGITEVGMLEVLKALEITDFIDRAQDLGKNRATLEQRGEPLIRLTQRIEELIKEWQRKNMSEADLAVLAEVIAREEADVEEIERPDFPGFERNVLSNDDTEQSELIDDEMVVDLSRLSITYGG